MTKHTSSTENEEPAYLQAYNQFLENWKEGNSRLGANKHVSENVLGAIQNVAKKSTKGIKIRSKTPVLRVNQLDALLLNQAIEMNLENYLQRIIPVSHWFHSISKYGLKFYVKYMCLIRMPEKLLLQLKEKSIHKESTLERKLPRMTLGDQMQNLCYRSSRRKMLLFIIVTVFEEAFFPIMNVLLNKYNWGELPPNVHLPDIASGSLSAGRISLPRTNGGLFDHQAPLTFRQRLEQYKINFIHTCRTYISLYNQEAYKYIIWKLTFNLEKMMKVASLLNFIIFLLQGRYRSISDRICCMRLHYAQKLMSRQVSFDFMNRDLIWDGFAELILFLLPILNIRWIIKKLQNSISSFVNIFGNSRKQTIQEYQQPNSLTEVHPNCAFCQSRAISPHIISPCSHIYCYYCLMKQFSQEDDSIQCSLCGTKANKWERLSFDSFSRGQVEEGTQ